MDVMRFARRNEKDIARHDVVRFSVYIDIIEIFDWYADFQSVMPMSGIVVNLFVVPDSNGTVLGENSFLVVTLQDAVSEVSVLLVVIEFYVIRSVDHL